jgi:hypothetical protein
MFRHVRREIPGVWYQVADVDNEIGEHTREAHQSSCDGADPDGGAQVEQLEDSEQDVIRELAEHVVVLVDSVLPTFAVLPNRTEHMMIDD